MILISHYCDICMFLGVERESFLFSDSFLKNIILRAFYFCGFRCVCRNFCLKTRKLE
jgi:hypothetical protein